MAPNVQSDTGSINNGDERWRKFTYSQIRQSKIDNNEELQLLAIHGSVYNLPPSFLKSHPGGAVIQTAIGRDATTLFETHHTLVPAGISSVKAILQKFKVGIVEDYTPIADFETPFAKALIERVRKVVGNKPRRDSFYATSSVLFFYCTFTVLVVLAFRTQSLIIAALLGAIMSVGHVCGHAGNHWSLSSSDWVNKFISVTCTNLWGLREKYWEFSHLISHHCYNYTDKDYIMEQHVPMSYFRVRASDPWRPIHAYQHWVYITTFFTSFVLGAIRLDCAPWIVLSPVLKSLRRNNDSPLPAPQFFASGSNVENKDLKDTEDGVGPEHFVVFDTWFDNAVSLVLSNVIWLPLFIHTWHRSGLVHAVLLNSIAFGTQAAVVTKNLLTQHMCEDIKLETSYTPSSDWYAMQIEASTTVEKPAFAMWLSYAISYQTEHHMFPSLNPALLVAIQPVVQEVSKEFGLRYNYLPSEREAIKSVFRQFRKLSVNPSLPEASEGDKDRSGTKKKKN